MQTRCRIRAVLWAGTLAAVTSTAAQLLVWLLFTDALPQILFRDMRLAAAIALGDDILVGEATFSWPALIASSVVHVAISLAYAWLMLAVAGALPGSRLLTGMVLGGAMFFVNLYGFTWLFPWFAVTRDFITFIAHVVFGATVLLASDYRGCKGSASP